MPDLSICAQCKRYQGLTKDDQRIKCQFVFGKNSFIGHLLNFEIIDNCNFILEQQMKMQDFQIAGRRESLNSRFKGP